MVYISVGWNIVYFNTEECFTGVLFHLLLSFNLTYLGGVFSGFAFVYMDDERDAEDAIRGLDRIEFGRKGRRLRIEWSKVILFFWSRDPSLPLKNPQIHLVFLNGYAAGRA